MARPRPPLAFCLKHQHPLPATDDRDGWRAHWATQGQPWRTEPEIDQERQTELEHCLAIVSEIEKGIYPFKGMKLSRADVEWLLATHEHGRGPVSWNDESQRGRKGLDLRGASLQQVDLNNLPLARLKAGLGENEWFDASEEQRAQASICLQGASLRKTQLEGASLSGAQLEEADLYRAQLAEAELLSCAAQESQFLPCAARENQSRRGTARGNTSQRSEARGNPSRRGNFER